MKLKRLAITRLPGINEPFEIESAGAGFHVIFGPNGIGKSSICRAVAALYWDDRGSSQRISINGEFELDGETWWAEREGSRVRWQRGGEESVPPNLPASRNHDCFFLRLRDLIDPSPDGTQDIATEIRRQMSGGFDLEQIAADLVAGVKPQHGRRERNEFNKALQDVQEAEGKQFSLQQRSDQLDALGTQLDAAESGERRLTFVERALGLAGRLQENAARAEEIALLPEGLAKLTGKEVEQIEQLQGQIDELNERARIVEGQRKAARDAKSDSRLSAPLGEAELAIWRENADELSRLELTLQAARAEHSACRKELAAALSALGGGEVDEVNLNLDDHGQLFEFLRAVEAHRAKVGAIKERLRLLANLGQSDDDHSELEKFRDAVDALRSWLRTPESQVPLNKGRARLSWVLIASAMFLLGAGLAIFVDPMFALLAAVGAGIAIPVVGLHSPGVTSGTRATAQEAFGKLDIEKPDTWDVLSVESRLRSLEGEIAAIDSRMQRARDRDVERQNLSNELEGLSEEETSLDARRQGLADSLNLDVIPPNAELVDFALALDRHRSARIKDERATGEVDDIEARRTVLLSDLASTLERFGEPHPEDAQSAGAYLNSLADRNSRLVRAISDEKQATAQLEQVSADRSAALNSLEQIYSEVGLNDSDLHGLTVLLDLLPHYVELTNKAVRLEGKIDLDRAELAKAGEADLAECDAPTLKRLHDDLSQTANRAAGLRDEIAEISAQVSEARRGSNVQDLIVVREKARASLLDRRDEKVYAKAGKFLIDAVEAEYEQTQMPRVFERALTHFSAFTQHNYELRLGKEAKAPRLFAKELRSGEGRELDELSDGTRIQLLLAARIAYAEEVEQGMRLPLFFDEALDQSDPARFEAIVRSLGRVANDQDRQIFYLTSDPGDIDRIRHALAKENCEIADPIDLGLIRTKAASVSGPDALHVGPRPTVPAPDELSAEEYGVALGVPLFAPAFGYEQQHFFYVLSDDLNLLQDFLVTGIERVGQWRTVSGTALAEKLGSRSISSQEIEFRAALLEIFCELWKEGRGRPIDREALEDSDALTEHYLDDVVAIADELDGDPQRFIDALASKGSRPKGFQRKSLENLERYLHDNGYLDDRPVLGENDLLLRALASPAASELPEGVAGDCLNRWWTLAAKLPETESR